MLHKAYLDAQNPLLFQQGLFDAFVYFLISSTYILWHYICQKVRSESTGSEVWQSVVLFFSKTGSGDYKKITGLSEMTATPRWFKT